MFLPVKEFGDWYRKPNVVWLHVHLPNQQLITWNEEKTTNVQAIVEVQGDKDTILKVYFKANTEYPPARELFYQDFPSIFVWKDNIKK